MIAIVANNKTGIWSHAIPNQSSALVITSVLLLLVTTVFFGLRSKERWKFRPRSIGRWRLMLYEIGPWKLGPYKVGPWTFRFWGFDDLPVGFRRDTACDTMAAAAYITLFIQTILGGLAAHYGFGKHRADIMPTFPKAMHYFFLYQICYKPLGGFTKLTFCFLYLRVFVYPNPEGFYRRHFESMVIYTAVVTGAGTVAFTVATIFQCSPVQRAWDQRIPGHCTDNLSFWFSHAAFNTAADLVVFVLPLPVISGMPKARRYRNGLIYTFSLGAFVIAASIARMIHLRGSAASTSDPTWGSMPALIWTEIEANTAVIVCCCPALSALVKRLWRRMRTFVGQSVSLDSASHKHPSNQNSAPPPRGEIEGPSSPKIGRSTTTTGHCQPFWGLLDSLWRKIRGKPNIQDSDLESRPYIDGHLAYVYPVTSQEETRKPWFGRSKQHNTDASQANNEDEQTPVSYLAPKVKFGGIFGKQKKTDAGGTPPGGILQHQDVLVSTHRRSMLEQQREDIELAQWRRQNAERENSQGRKIERQAMELDRQATEVERRASDKS